MKFGLRMVLYLVAVAATAVMSLVCFLIYRDRAEFVAHSVDAVCTVLNFTVRDQACDDLYEECRRTALVLRYANYTGTLGVWGGITDSEARTWVALHYPIGSNFSCVYSTADPSIVRLARPFTTVWVILGLVALGLLAVGVGGCFAGELHHAYPEGPCVRSPVDR